jgi:hypothetical protein
LRHHPGFADFCFLLDPTGTLPGERRGLQPIPKRPIGRDTEQSNFSSRASRQDHACVGYAGKRITDFRKGKQRKRWRSQIEGRRVIEAASQFINDAISAGVLDELHGSTCPWKPMAAVAGFHS